MEEYFSFSKDYSSLVSGANEDKVQDHNRHSGTLKILMIGDGLTAQGIAQDREIFPVSLLFLLFSSLHLESDASSPVT